MSTGRAASATRPTVVSNSSPDQLFANQVKNKKKLKKMKKKANKKFGGKNGKGSGQKPRNGSRDKKKVKTDARVQTSTLPLNLSNQQHSITITVPISDQQVFGVCQAAVSYALSKGFAAFAEYDYDPYYAAVYMYNILVQYITGGVAQAVELPHWLLSLGQALTPKRVPFQNGEVSYSWNAGSLSQYNPQGNLPLGFVPYGFSYCLGYANTNVTTFDGFPTVSYAGFPGYSSDNGQFAFQEMCLFLASCDNTASTKLVSSASNTRFARDVSAFAVCSLQEGLGVNGLGGFEYQYQHEVPVFHPILSTFVNGSAGIDSLPNRNFNLSNMFAGDTIFTGGMMSTFLPESKWAFKRAPRFHAVDFNEFLDVVAQWIASLQQSWINNYDSTSGVSYSSVMCPLTLQEVGLLLRNVMMSAFKETQPSVQSLYPIAPQSSEDNQFVPFACGSNTVYLGSSDMLLPIPIIENIRALVARAVKCGYTAQDVQLYIPVLGEYAADRLISTDYVYTSLDQTYPSFNIVTTERSPVYVLSVDEKSRKEVKVNLAEAYISYVDGNTTIGSPPILQYAFINDPATLKMLTGIFNSWLSQTGLQDYSIGLGNLGTEQGIKALCSIASTRHWVPTSESRMAVNAQKVDLRVKRMRGALNPYSTRNAVAYTSQGVILAAPYEQVLQTWIVPTNLIQDNGGNADSDFVRWQSIMGEPYSAALTTGTDGQNLSDLHTVYAQKMIKGKLSTPNDWQKVFDEYAAQGRGGILSGIGAFLDDLIGL